MVELTFVWILDHTSKNNNKSKYDLMVSKTEDIVADYFVHCLIEESNVVQIKGYIDHVNFKV